MGSPEKGPGFLESLKAKGGKMARTIALGAGLMGAETQAHAGNDAQETTNEKYALSPETIKHFEVNEDNITASGAWAKETEKELKSIETRVARLQLSKEDAAREIARLEEGALRDFTREYYFPTKGVLTEGQYGKDRTYTFDDLALIYNIDLEIDKDLHATDTKYGTQLTTGELGEKNLWQLQDMRLKTERHMQNLNK